mgnify:CR=1 FL=1
MIKFALLGTGRIGKFHAEIINSHANAEIKYTVLIQALKVVMKVIVSGLKVVTNLLLFVCTLFILLFSDPSKLILFYSVYQFLIQLHRPHH